MRNVTLALALVLLGFSSINAEAAAKPQDPKKQTDWDLYLTSEEAYDMKQEKGKEILFIDVREPLEIMFTGYTDIVDINIPYLLANPSKWNPKKPKFAMERNPNYAAAVATALADRGLGKSSPVILMCRSGGTRGAPSAQALKSLGLEKVYVVVDGFEGSKAKDHPKGPWRVVNGWKNAGLPWSYKLNPTKIFTRPSQ